MNLLDIFEAAVDNERFNGGEATSAADFGDYASGALNVELTSQQSEKMARVRADILAEQRDGTLTSNSYYYMTECLRDD